MWAPLVWPHALKFGAFVCRNTMNEDFHLIACHTGITAGRDDEFSAETGNNGTNVARVLPDDR